MKAEAPKAWGGCSTPRARHVLSSLLCALTLALIGQPAWSACSLSVVGVIFGSYDTFNSVPLDSTGNVGVTCNLPTAYTIALSPGGGTYAARAMSRAGSVLNYNLYTDPTRLLIWGDGTPGTLVVPGLGTSANHTVYARIPASQNVPVGNYSDTVVVTLTF